MTHDVGFLCSVRFVFNSCFLFSPLQLNTSERNQEQLLELHDRWVVRWEKNACFFFFLCPSFTLTFYFIVMKGKEKEHAIRSSLLSHLQLHLCFLDRTVPFHSVSLFSFPFYSVHASVSLHYNRIKEKRKEN